MVEQAHGARLQRCAEHGAVEAIVPDARGGTTQTRTFTYDSGTQRLTQATTPEAGTVQYSYNPDGTLHSKTDAMTQQTQYQYDSLARVTQVSYLPNGSEDQCQRVYYQYDGYPYNDPFYGQGANPIGRLTGTYWSGGPSCSYGFWEQYAYDAQGRVWGRAFTMTEPGNNVQPITLTSYFNYDAEGRLTVSQYPAAVQGSPNLTTTYTTDHDALGRQIDLSVGTPQQPPVVSSATYNAAGQLTAMYASAYTETRQYNANLQLTRLSAPPVGGWQGVDLTYTYPAGNNGRISQMTDNITGEQVSYTYDQLNRLVQSVSSVMGTMPFAYDGFGNLMQQGQTTLSVDANTNRINSAGYQYNANGNVTQTPGSATYAYDVANRLVSNNAIYNPRNQRVFDGTNIYLYTPDGKLAAKYSPAWGQSASNAFIQGGQPNVYFAGKLIQEQGQWVMTDRLGSVRLNGTARSSYQPYGAEVTPTSDQRTKFATYYRDSAGLDYAGQRYYGNVMGRFLTPDAGGMAADTSDPGSWNRYAYVGGDPVNFADRHGRYRNIVGSCGDLVNGQPQDGCDDGGGGDDEGGSFASGVCGYWEVGFVETSCPSYAPVPVSTPAPTPPKGPTCDQLLTIEIGGYLGRHGSPLASLAAQFVSVGRADDVDPRFLVALSRAESTWGEHITAKQGPYNAWSVNTHYGVGYSSFSEALQDVASLLGTDVRYIPGGNISAAGIYGVFNKGYDPTYFENTIGADLTGLGGSRTDVRFPCDGFN